MEPLSPELMDSARTFAQIRQFWQENDTLVQRRDVSVQRAAQEVSEASETQRDREEPPGAVNPPMEPKAPEMKKSARSFLYRKFSGK
ncbi:Hypothetical protein SMAX5B_003323 [Scophthalmus maximus]|uniref:Uncharacterized protein n=1 Tax=Scophthalmus maximus TaxID=52904 RepID=A0A2U9BDT2_SCOMX|nr:Hypothetical protein SMAX5B_003323 [Scophthalmus maximus]KAF0035572.1 hypothetical protein F2P81_013330 [Scophthalmus maximus]